MKIVITGGLGFIGSHLCDLLAKQNHQIILISKSFSKNNEPKGQPAPNPKDMQSLLKNLRSTEKQKEKSKTAMLYKSKEKKKKSPTFKSRIGSSLGGNTDDFLPNYKVGNRTYINTLANPNIAYYVELRRKFRFTFNPVPAIRHAIHQISRGQIAVVLGVSVDPGGNINELIVIRSSGISSYDYEAKRTVMSSAPFSKPPQHMIAKDNLAHMAWTFVVYL